MISDLKNTEPGGLDQILVSLSSYITVFRIEFSVLQLMLYLINGNTFFIPVKVVSADVNLIPIVEYGVI